MKICTRGGIITSNGKIICRAFKGGSGHADGDPRQERWLDQTNHLNCWNIILSEANSQICRTVINIFQCAAVG